MKNGVSEQNAERKAILAAKAKREETNLQLSIATQIHKTKICRFLNGKADLNFVNLKAILAHYSLKI